MALSILEIYAGFIIILLVVILGYLFFQAYKKNSVCSLKQLMLIGLAGVGKTLTYNYLQCKNIGQFETFQIGTSGELCLVDSPDMDLESKYEKRETRIKQFQQFFNKFKNTINGLIIVVNFERTDLMKQKIIKVLKYLKKFQPDLYLLISNFDLSENQSQDEQQLKEQLKLFKFKKIFFVDKYKDNSDLKQELLQIYIEQPNFRIDLQDTIFEEINKNDEEKCLQQLKNQMSSDNNPNDILLSK
ncbi:unnamed protein product [Paramecium sonneborni]|uniref:Uncharacterized protein n=1 Tax=Paramecium sonneborni TaxID=65129 RepID=A0A8S1NND3_9CILI|nr:unnamed protein product [Paramecium sonneborni]